ncbi:Asp23/Gls24 family envelope stress response protein [Cellulomonas xiejunii]|uniref:Asp23/Gls24 family envelope stress response protein n=1 Tax=Cellulomonas xiejunii TaxID=2968083 RepID=A0ABY5KSF5_9CELL|nr:Asp23/Gls24 family envelope stress response protein [Cellulomonas xiejunii]MCC2314955.1 Asp23/Gls24 family envelope stress response protein [Cellulomonas xiejunii]MCC2321574.1 Asp23/Gls24 family envelope stress response protein [Cellulomonas xiejunii]MCC2323274.1 Asp23/Gls24 family envelope stress response protein [Cellulomonas xiejunii]UUI72142.1 Asp23/Gls24 family envelope stress response protein [Cellulomonas xiejunii]
MADVAVADVAVADVPPATAPEARGTLTVSDRVVQKVARAAASRVHGVVETTSGLLGRDLPHASAHTHGTRAQVQVDVALAWPAPAAGTARRVRDAVEDAVLRYAGVRADRVDVRVVAVTDPAPLVAERVR